MAYGHINNTHVTNVYILPEDVVTTKIKRAIQ